MVVSSFPRNCSASLPPEDDTPLIVVSTDCKEDFMNNLKSCFNVSENTPFCPDDEEYIVNNGVGCVRLKFTAKTRRNLSVFDPNNLIRADAVLVELTGEENNFPEILTAFFNNVDCGSHVYFIPKIFNRHFHSIIFESQYYGYAHVIDTPSENKYAFYNCFSSFLAGERPRSAFRSHFLQSIGTMTDSEELQSSNIATVNDIDTNSPTTIPDNETLTVPNDSLTPIPDDETSTDSDCSSTNILNDETLTVPVDSLTPLPDDETLTVPVDSLTPLPDDETLTVPVDSLTPIPEGNSITILPGDTLQTTLDSESTGTAINDICPIPCSVM